MKTIPETENALVLRTDFSDDAAWGALCQAIQKPVGEHQAYVDCVSDAEYDGLTVEQLMSLVPTGFDQIMSEAPAVPRYFVFMADRATFAHPDRPILVVDLLEQPGRTFRVIPSMMYGVENNLTLLNMAFSDFADHTGFDGIFSGFPKE